MALNPAAAPAPVPIDDDTPPAGPDVAVLATTIVDRIAAALTTSAIVVGEQATWLTPQLAPTADGRGGEAPAEPTLGRTGVACLYDGSAGIGWALAMVGAQRGRAELIDLAQAALRHALARAEEDDRPGLYDGRAGIALAAVAGGGRLGADDLVLSGRDLLRSAGATTPAGDDLIDGTAGIALACLRGAQLTGDDALLAAAQRQVGTLVGRAHRQPWGWSWPGIDGPGLCGIAHGAAGAAWAIGEVAAADGARPGTAVTDDGHDPALAPLITARDEARRYERSWFDPRSSTWPDLRSEVAGADGTPPRPNLWCHGGVGIGLSRLALHALDPHPALLGEAVAALTAASREALQQVDTGVLPSGLTVCHGLGGTLALLLTAADQVGEPVHRETAHQLCLGAVDLLGEEPAGWPGGLLHQPGPGLLTGLAGTLLVLAGLEDPAMLAPLTRLGA